MRWILVAFLFVYAGLAWACDDKQIVEVEAPPDTVYVTPQTWVGVEFTWADSGPLNSDVEDHRRAGWDCGSSLLDLPYWFPLDDEYDNWLLVVAHFYLCTAPQPGMSSAPFQVPEVIKDLADEMRRRYP